MLTRLFVERLTDNSRAARWQPGRRRAAHAPLFLALLDRPGTRFFDAEAERMRAYVAAASKRCTLGPPNTRDVNGEHLLIQQVLDCR